MTAFITALLAVLTGLFTALVTIRKAKENYIEPNAWPTPENTPPPPQPTPMPEEPKYKWDTVANAKHSVRVICDEEGLTVDQKNKLCATVGAESGWMSYYLSGPKVGQPVKLENRMNNGVVWSTDFGICQINTHFWIGPGKEFPSVEYVLDNPEKCIRWMVRNWKAGHSSWWVGFTSGNYKNYL